MIDCFVDVTCTGEENEGDVNNHDEEGDDGTADDDFDKVVVSEVCSTDVKSPVVDIGVVNAEDTNDVKFVCIEASFDVSISVGIIGDANVPLDDGSDVVVGIIDNVLDSLADAVDNIDDVNNFVIELLEIV